MLELLNIYKEKVPEIVFEWKDSLSEARGWVVINSLKNGAAGGGTRMRKGLTKDEVVSLAKVMEIKFSVSGPAIGGAKSGIDFDPSDPRREEVLKRWYGAVLPLLKHYYGTGGDLNVDELKDVIPITEDLGLWHPQEGIVNGHFNMKDGAKINIIGQLRYGCSKTVEDYNYIPKVEKKYAVADLITGYGVSESVKHYYQIFKKQDLNGKRVIIQGWGNVASAAGYYLSRNGAKIVGIIDRQGGLINEVGFSQSEIEALFINKQDNKLFSDELLPFEVINNRIWDLNAEIFIPGAASKIVNRDQVDRMMKAGLELMSCGANVPFVDDDIFFGPTASYVDSKISIIPDFIANCGMARVFAYLMQPDVPMTDKDIFEDVSIIIKKGVQNIHDNNKGDNTYLCNKAIELALNNLKN